MITLNVPVAAASIVSVDIDSVLLDLRSSLAVFVYQQTDAGGVVTGGRTTMTGPAFQTAFLAASGNIKTRLHTVLQGAVPAFAGPVT